MPSPASMSLILPFLVVGLFIGPLTEELGWRGYTLPRLLDRWSSVPAALVLGVPWACWHLPLHAMDTGGQERAPLTAFLLSVIALSVLYTWIWRVTHGSVMIALLLHSADAAGVILLRDARSDFGPAVVATVLTFSVAAAVAARHLHGWRPGRAVR